MIRPATTAVDMILPMIWPAFTTVAGASPRAVRAATQAAPSVVDVADPERAELGEQVALDVAVVSGERGRPQVDDARPPPPHPVTEPRAAMRRIDVAAGEFAMVDAGEEPLRVGLQLEAFERVRPCGSRYRAR